MTRPTPALALCALTLASTTVAQEVNVYPIVSLHLSSRLWMLLRPRQM